jgi:plasmid stabilization system protein ParE
MGGQSRYRKTSSSAVVRVRWTSQSLGDIARLHAFLVEVNRSSAAKIVRSFTAAARQLREHPRSGEVLEEFAPREVRRLIVGPYELRYEVTEQEIFILRLWHGHEDR